MKSGNSDGGSIDVNAVDAPLSQLQVQVAAIDVFRVPVHQDGDRQRAPYPLHDRPFMRRVQRKRESEQTRVLLQTGQQRLVESIRNIPVSQQVGGPYQLLLGRQYRSLFQSGQRVGLEDELLEPARASHDANKIDGLVVALGVGDDPDIGMLGKDMDQIIQ